MNTTASGNQAIWYPSEAYTSATFNRSLGTAVEELFQNTTLSLFSNPAFLENSTDTVEITYGLTQNIYAYNRRNLLVSYGLAVGFALVASIVGCVSIFFNDASYSNRFSTILRTTRGQELEELVASNDRSGIDPLPQYLAKTRLDLRRGQLEPEHDLDAERAGMIGERTAMMDVSQGDGQSAISPWRRSDSISLASASTNVGMDQGDSVEPTHPHKTGVTEQSREIDWQR